MLDKPRALLKVRAWGLWDVPFAEQYDRELQKNILEIGESAPGGWCVLVDLDAYPPQFPEVQDVIMRGMKFGVEHGLKKEARIIGKLLTKTQLARLVKEAGMPENSTFQSEKEAIAWLFGK